jgi:predicted nuclease with TOPRIM domain
MLGICSVRAAELEKARMKTHIVSLKEKIADLEAEKTQYLEQIALLRGGNEKLESYRSSASRKDGIITKLRDELAKAKFEYDALKLDTDKRAVDFEHKIR